MLAGGGVKPLAGDGRGWCQARNARERNLLVGGWVVIRGAHQDGGTAGGEAGELANDKRQEQRDGQRGRQCL